MLKLNKFNINKTIHNAHNNQINKDNYEYRARVNRHNPYRI